MEADKGGYTTLPSYSRGIFSFPSYTDQKQTTKAFTAVLHGLAPILLCNFSSSAPAGTFLLDKTQSEPFENAHICQMWGSKRPPYTASLRYCDRAGKRVLKGKKKEISQRIPPFTFFLCCFLVRTSFPRTIFW